MPRHYGWQLALLMALILCGGLWLAAGTVVFAQGTYNYTVQNGDSWDSVAQRTGISVESLQAANPEAAERENGWLLVGETLVVPASLSESSTSHRVKSGESWNSIADQYGISVALLRAANPQAIRTGNILYRGEILTIPAVGSSIPAAQPTSAATATPEETPALEASATVTSTDIGAEQTPEATDEVAADETPTVENTPEATSTEETSTVTPEAAAEIGAPEVMTETVPATVTVAATSTGTSNITSTVTSTVTDTESITGTAGVTATEGITGSEGVTTTEGAASGAGDISSSDLPACPDRFADYPGLMTDLINAAPDGLNAVVAFLTSCDALVDDGVSISDLNGDGSDDLVVVYQNPSKEQIFVEGDLVIFNSTPNGYALGYRARAAGEVRLLTVDDINLDELPDVAWVDTTCGASTCFDTVNVRSWDGSTWADWTDGTITMAYAEINVADTSEVGSGEEITLEGGIYGSVGAGPQRSRTETWASVDGGPYSLAEKSYSQTECLYHTVLDANRAFLDAPSNGFEAATALYTQAVEDETLIKCWVRNDELAELRSFSLFRLAVIAGYSDDSATATAQIEKLSTEYPGSIYDEVGQLWLKSYDASGDAAAACQDVTTFAQEDSAAWEMLADYGYTNPSFEAVDVCPILDLSAEATPEAEATPAQ
jgi:LysM repeat protein